MRAFFGSHNRYFEGDFVRPGFIDNHEMDRRLLINNNDSGASERAAATQNGYVAD